MLPSRKPRIRCRESRSKTTFPRDDTDIMAGMRMRQERSRSAWDQARSELVKIKLEAILQEADILFARKGHNSTSLDDIASRLHITHRWQQRGDVHDASD